METQAPSPSCPGSLLKSAPARQAVTYWNAWVCPDRALIRSNDLSKCAESNIASKAIRAYSLRAEDFETVASKLRHVQGISIRIGRGSAA